MKTEKEIVTEIVTTVVLKMTPEEARILRALVGSVSGGFDTDISINQNSLTDRATGSEVRKLTSDIYETLSEYGSDQEENEVSF